MEKNFDSPNFEPEKEYIKTLELSVQMLQREISLLRSQKSELPDLLATENKYLGYLKDLGFSHDFNNLKSKLEIFFKSLFEIYEFDLFIYDNQNKLKSTNNNTVQTLLESKVDYLEEEGIIDWALNSENFSFIKDLTVSANEKDLFFIIIPIRFNNQNKGILVITTPNSKETLIDDAINVINQLNLFLPLAVDNIESNIHIQNMNTRLQSLNAQVVESSYMASISGLLKSMIIEMQQPLLIMESNIKLIEHGIDNSQKRFDIINEQIQKLNEIYDFFKKITSENYYQIIKVKQNLGDILLDSLGMISSQLKREGISFEMEINDNNVEVDCYPTQLGHAIINIVMFLSSRNQDIGTISINLSKSSKKQAIITFIDNGVGLSDEELSYLQYPESSDLTFPYLVEMQYIYKVIELNNGKMFINSDVSRGTTVKLIFSLV